MMKMQTLYIRFARYVIIRTELSSKKKKKKRRRRKAKIKTFEKKEAQLLLEEKRDTFCKKLETNVIRSISNTQI